MEIPQITTESRALTKKEFLFIQPRINPPLGEKSLIQLADNRLILRSMAKKNAEFAGFGH